MSLSARIALRASRRLDVIAAAVAIGGAAVATMSAAIRWPEFAWWVVPVAAVATALAIFRFRSGSDATTYALSVSDRPEIAVSPDPESGDGESSRLDDSTMMWPGFSVVGLRRGSDAVQGGRSMRVAVFDAEASTIDRRSLHRFLLWSLRGGPGDGSSRTKASR